MQGERERGGGRGGFDGGRLSLLPAVPREVQFYLLNQGALLTLLQLTDHDANSTVRVKALYAVSCLVREQEAGLQDFLSHDGFSVLMRGMQSDSEKLRTKSAFLLLNLLTSRPEHKGFTQAPVWIQNT